MGAMLGVGIDGADGGLGAIAVRFAITARIAFGSGCFFAVTSTTDPAVDTCDDSPSTGAATQLIAEETGCSCTHIGSGVEWATGGGGMLKSNPGSAFASKPKPLLRSTNAFGSRIDSTAR